MKLQEKKRIVVGVTGASGAVYGQALLNRLDTLEDQVGEVAVIFSENGKNVWKYELNADPKIPAWMKVFDPSEIDAAPASGSAGYSHMIICPCSMATLARIAHGISTDLMTRAADVMLKERRTLILAPREMPYSLIHLRNMETLTLAGGIICPASPSFYSLPANLDAAIVTVIEKLLSLCGLDTHGYRWAGYDQKQ
jgi:flavin prenyltransferase